ncbi:calponin-homology (CH) domain-containing protein [Pycnococcus provasolii]
MASAFEPSPALRQVTRVDRRFGRLELLGWLNDTLQTDYSKVEDCGDGVAYLQLADAILPGKVPLERMHFTCRSRDDRERNLNILRHVLKRAQVSRDVDVPSLSSCSFRQNNDMLQWFFTFVQLNFPTIATSYPAVERRESALALQRERVLRKSAHRSRSPFVKRSPMFFDAAVAARPASASLPPEPAPQLFARYGGAETVCRELEADLAARRRNLAVLERRLHEAQHARDVSLGALQSLLSNCAELEMELEDAISVGDGEATAAALVLDAARSMATAPIDVGRQQHDGPGVDAASSSGHGSQGVNQGERPQ